MALDPSLFHPSAISPETAKFNADLAAMMAGAPPIDAVPPAQQRANREAGGGPFGAPQTVAEAVDRQIPGRAGPVTVRIIRPEGAARGVYLDIHGGGWVLGRAHHGDVANLALAKTLQVAVVSVDYRLAPEHPYPAGPDDCEDAAAWLVANAKAEFGTDALLIGGGSAGAHLAAVTLLRMRDRHGYNGFKAANMIFGVFDVGQTPSSLAASDANIILKPPSMAWFAKCFVPSGDYRDPDVSPLYADLRGLPPALFTVGTLDPLLDDSLFMHSRWLAAGNESELAVYPGGIHGFTGFPTALGRESVARTRTFLAKYV